MTWTRFPSKQSRDAYCLTLLRKTAEWAEKVTMLYEISPSGVVKHLVLNWPLQEHDGNILYLFQTTCLKVFWVALDCWYAVAGVALSKKKKKIISLITKVKHMIQQKLPAKAQYKCLFKLQTLTLSNGNDIIALPIFFCWISDSMCFLFIKCLAQIELETGSPLERRLRKTGSVNLRCSSEEPSGLNVSVTLTSNLSCNLNT